MAPIGEAYFPPLDRCFSGQHQLISWKTTFTTLSQFDYGARNVSLKLHLTDPQTIQILARAFSPFEPPNTQTRSNFQTKTSAINVTPSSQARYDIKQIQEDTLWLSKQSNIDEVSALRIAVIEWQTRSLVQLLHGRSEEQFTYQNGAERIGDLRASIFDPGSSLLAPSITEEGKRSTENFEDLNPRRQRLLETYLSEKRCILKCCEYLTFYALCIPKGSPMGLGDQDPNSTDWVREVGANVLSSWNLDDSRKGDRKHPVIEAVDALRARLESMGKGSGWLQDEGVQEEIELAWARSQILEMIHIMQITLNLLESTVDLVKSSAILSWFRLMKDSEFYDNVQLPPMLQIAFGIPLISLPALISLAILSLPSALDLLERSATANISTTSEDHLPYLLNAATVNEINDILIFAARLKPASPAVMAWAIMMNTLRDTALSTLESKELRQSLRAADRYSTADSSDTDGTERSPSGKAGSYLRRRSSNSSDTSQQPTILENIHDTIAFAIADGGDPIAFLADNAAGSGSVFEVVAAIATDYCTPFGFEHEGRSGQKMRSVLLNLIRASADFVDYAPLLLTATLAVLTGSERYWESIDRSTEASGSEPAGVFLQDKVLKHKLYFVSMLHFPYESLPFLELCRALAFANNGVNQVGPAMWTILEDADNFTCSLPSKDYQAYVATRMQEEADFIELTEDLNVSIAPEQGSFSAHQSNGVPRGLKRVGQMSLHRIPSATSGKVMNDSRPFIVAWHQSYSPLTYMGKVLYCASIAGDLKQISNPLMSADIVGEIIGLITNMLSTATKSSTDSKVHTNAMESAQFILGLTSEGMSRNQDVISVVFDIFEKELYKPRKSSEDFESLEILVQCIHFTFALLHVMPDRVWPFLGRSSLLGIGKAESQLKSVIATQEMIIGRYIFLLGCIRLYDSLITDAIIHMVSRKTPTKSLARFGSLNSLGAGISPTTMEAVLLNYTQTMIEVFESTTKWRFLGQEDRMEINFRLSSTFHRILKYYFSVNDGPNTSHKLTSPLAPAAEYIIDVFLSQLSHDVVVSPLIQILVEGTMTRTTTLPVRGLQYWTAQVKAALRLSSILIRVNRLLQRPFSQLEEQMFRATSTLAKVYAAHESYRLPTVELLDSLVRSAAETHQQPPSLLGHLGQDASSQFLDVISMFDQPLKDDDLSLAIWRLLSAVVSKRQQWFAIFILTGTSPKESFKDKANPAGSSTRQHEPILNVALDALSNIDKLEPHKALGMLEFVAHAADFWPWVLGTMEKHGHFLKSISEYAAHIGTMTAASREKTHRTSTDHNSIQIASLVADILSMYTHYTQQIGNQKFAKMLVPHLTYLIKNAISVPNYNISLHGNLRRNFESKFPGCELTAFKRTTLTRSALGESYFYDLELANEMLSHEAAWVGRKGNDGFAEEVRRANLNLSLVEAQINLFHSWKSLLIELSGPLVAEVKFQKIMAVASTDCLRANAENNLPEAIFERLALSRANLAFTLLQRLLDAKSTQPEVLHILPVAWDTLRTYNTDLGFALDGDGAQYYRILLKILYLALQVNTISTSSPNSTPSQFNGTRSPPVTRLIVHIVLEITSSIVAQGFRSLIIILHDKSNVIYPSDFALITAILRSALQIPDVIHNTSLLLNAFSDSQTARCASTLLSWSDQLATSGDPVYGELSILFLVEMSSMPALAESLAVDGVLPHILTTNLVCLLQTREFGPFNQPIRMYSIWARGVLPLLLNLLHAVGPPLAAEIAAALNTFPHQLERASNVFTATSSSLSQDPNRSYITLGSASEAVTLSLITSILRMFREAGSSAGIESGAVEEVKWDQTQVKEEAESCLERRGSLRERIIATTEREELWSKEKPESEGSGAENKLEEKVVEEMRTVVDILNGNGE